MGLETWGIDKSWTLFLDRDGVINKRCVGGYILEAKNFEFEPGVFAALEQANQLFNRIIVVTNQQCVALELLTEEALAALHEYMITEITLNKGRIDAVFAATELKLNATRRKPLAAMGYEAKALFPEIDFTKSIMVGDTDSDVLFGKALGMNTVLVRSAEVTRENPDIAVDSLDAFIRKL